ncbi:hypothetical protein U1Q18_017800, partial [Sarracenia purpurea var. burkii]
MHLKEKKEKEHVRVNAAKNDQQHVACVGYRASRKENWQPKSHLLAASLFVQPGAKAPSNAIDSCSMLPPSPASSASLLLGAIE